MIGPLNGTRKTAWLCAAVFSIIQSSQTFADTLYESARSAQIGIDAEGPIPWAGSIVAGDVYTGVVFELPSPAVTTKIGSHFVRRQFDEDSFFAQSFD